MSRDLVISVAPGEIRAGLFADGEAIELRAERDERASLLGAVFLGRVQRVLPALPGAFIELGLDRPAFLPGDRLPTEGAALVVQVVKDAFDDKAPEVGRALSLHGEVSVWTPYRPGIAVSRQIPAAERARLSAVLAPLIRDGEGVVLRSHAAGAMEADLSRDIQRLREAHAEITRRAQTAEAPARLDPAPGPVERIAASFAGRFDRLVIDDRAELSSLRQTGVAMEASQKSGFGARTGLDDAFAEALATCLPLPDGASLWVEHGIAFTVIDVDLGAAAGGRGGAADTIRRTNLAAAKEVARHLRLRNVGGAIVIDFISMRSRRDQHEIEQSLRAAVADDPAGVELHGWTWLGHYELTRRRRTPSIPDLLLAPGGARRAKSPRTVALEVLRALVQAPFEPGGVTVHLHPTVGAELTGPLTAALESAEAEIGRRIRLEPNPARDPETFDIAGA